eukprot:1703326-Rhodomonas_salina.1
MACPVDKKQRNTDEGIEGDNMGGNEGLKATVAAEINNPTGKKSLNRDIEAGAKQMETGGGHRNMRKGTSNTAGRSRKLIYEPSWAAGEPGAKTQRPHMFDSCNQHIWQGCRICLNFCGSQQILVSAHVT